MIRFDGVTKVYKNDVKALYNVSFKIEKGEFVFIVGSSGAGKSTLIKLLLREIKATTGDVVVNDTDVNLIKRKEIPLYRRGIGVVFQDYRLLQDKTVYENVAFAMQITDCSNRMIKRRVPAILNMVSLGDKADRYPNELSGGEQQRISIARAIVNNPSLLIADEPTGNLDPVTSREIMKIISMVNMRGTTVIMATHDRDIVNAMKKRVITFHQGAIVRDQKKGGYFYED